MNDPVAKRMLASVAHNSGLAPPSDTSITSLYLTSIPAEHNAEPALRAFLTPLVSSGSSGIKSIVPVPTTNCAFVNFKTREDAEDAAEKLAMRNTAAASSTQVKISYGEADVGVQWGRPRKAKAELKKAADAEQIAVAA